MTWEANDISDIDALSQATAYCDIVVTDSKARHLIESTSLASRLNAKVLSSLNDLIVLLDS
jgi:hypothetical protein